MIKNSVHLFLSCILILVFLCFSPVQAVPFKGVIEKGTLHRFPDPVLVPGKAFSFLTQGALGNYRLYAFTEDKFAPIRFQIDEMTEEGDLIFPYGKKNNKKQSNNILDNRDVLLFMAHDAGDRVMEKIWPGNVTKGAEIEVIDPIDNTRSWVYFFFFEKNSPPLCTLENYFNYDYDTETLWSEYWKAQYIITEDGKHTTFPKKQYTLAKAGGTGENYMDRLKVRTVLKLFFGKVVLKIDEENLGSDVLAWIQGPIRVVKRLEQYWKGPLNMKLARATSDVQFYETMSTVPVNINIPFKVKRIVTSAVLRFGTDYAPSISGSMFYNSNNLQGVPIDGKMGDEEKLFNPAPDQWRVMTGEWGAFMTRNIYPPEIINNVKLTQGITDDDTLLDPPETYPGSIGYTWQDISVHDLPGGSYVLYLEFYTPPHYKSGDEKAYLNYLDHSLKLKIAGKVYQNQVKLHGKPGKEF